MVIASNRSMLILCACTLGAVVWAHSQIASQIAAQTQGGQPAASPEQRERQDQPGATQGGVTTSELDVTPKFNMDYFVGEWTFDSSLSESPLGPGGPISGTEIIRNVWDGRFWDITVKGEAPEGPFVGNGIIVSQEGFAGQSYARYEFTRGVALLKAGSMGCDLGGTCNLYFETPSFEHNGATIRLKGRYYLTSPLSYRVTTEISVDKSEYRNLGTMWYTKNQRVKPRAIR